MYRRWLMLSGWMIVLLLVFRVMSCASTPVDSPEKTETKEPSSTLDAATPKEEPTPEPVAQEPPPPSCESPLDCKKAACAQRTCGEGCLCMQQKGREIGCNDGKDNDWDVKIDCADTDCDGQSCGEGCVCKQLQKIETNCNDGNDNDGDGLVDCKDVDCEGVSCGEGCVCKDLQKTELFCNNKDNDGDGLFQCHDPDCEGRSCGKDCRCKQGNTVTCSQQTLSQLFKTRIEPLIKKGAPSSCNQCHLSGVDLSLFVRDTPCRSMACLQSQGLVNFVKPKESKILKDILRADPKSALITKKVQEQEYKGFLEWIEYSSLCQESLCGKISNACGTGGTNPPPQKTLPMLGKCDEATLVKSFRTLVAPERGRCYHCHASDSGHPQAPGYFDPKDDYDGDRRSMYNIIGMKALDLKNPENSLLLTKPLATAEGGVQHGGGDKIQNKEEDTYKNILKWIQFYASCQNK